MVAANKAETGIVRIHAQIKSMVTVHLTAVIRLIIPTPMMDPVIVWVVLTGIPSIPVPNKVIAPAVSAEKPSKGVNLVILLPMVLTIRHPPESVPTAMDV